jgi:hypothetical protein
VRDLYKRHGDDISIRDDFVYAKGQGRKLEARMYDVIGWDMIGYDRIE